MITGKTKHNDTVKIDTRTDSKQIVVTLSVIYSNGAGFAMVAGSIEEAKQKAVISFGDIIWEET